MRPGVQVARAIAEKVSCTKRRLYATPSRPASSAAVLARMRISCGASVSRATAKNISLDKKPLSNGIPAIASDAVIASALVTGIKRRRLPSLRMSRVPVSWSMMPAAMNNEALNTAWLMR